MCVCSESAGCKRNKANGTLWTDIKWCYLIFFKWGIMQLI
jgi:hypothetical protein